MIQKETVLVLGAGASLDFGYPLGDQLRLEIWDSLARHPRSSLYDCLRRCGFDDACLASFVEELGRAQTGSVDEFLGQRPEFQDVGKCAMAASLIRREQEAGLLHPNARTSWYGMLLDELRRSRESFGCSRLSIVTFNYDRALEHYLFSAIRSYYNIPEVEAAQALGRVRIIHVYGTLMPLPYQRSGGRPYAADWDPGSIRESAATIRTMAEARSVVEPIPAIVELMRTAKVVCFLGFGYHDHNLRLLGLEHLGADADMYCGAFGMTALQRADLKQRLNRFTPVRSRSGREPSFGMANWTVLECLQNFPVLLQIGE